MKGHSLAPLLRREVWTAKSFVGCWDMKRMKKLIGDESGAALVIEMTMIFPLVCMIVLFLVYIGCYILQSVVMYTEAQRIAVIAAYEAQMPGYENFFEEGSVTFKADFNKSVLNQVMKVHDPYRYIGKGFLKSDNQKTLQDSLRSLIESSSFLASASIQDCTVEADGSLLAPRIKVTVTEETPIPGIFRMLELEEERFITVTVLATVHDNSEFIRNTDIVFDICGRLWNEFKFGSNNQTMAERVRILKGKFNDSMKRMGL